MRGAWQKNNGMRIDHFLVSNSLIRNIKDIKINKYPRGKEKPSDHTPIEITISIDTDIISCILSAKIVPRLIDRFDFDSLDNRTPLYKSPTLMKATELANHPIKIIPDNLIVLGIFFPLALSIFASFAIIFHLKPLKIKLK